MSPSAARLSEASKVTDCPTSAFLTEAVADAIGRSRTSGTTVVAVRRSSPSGSTSAPKEVIVHSPGSGSVTRYTSLVPVTSCTTSAAVVVRSITRPEGLVRWVTTSLPGHPVATCNVADLTATATVLVFVWPGPTFCRVD